MMKNMRREKTISRGTDTCPRLEVRGTLFASKAMLAMHQAASITKEIRAAITQSAVETLGAITAEMMLSSAMGVSVLVLPQPHHITTTRGKEKDDTHNIVQHPGQQDPRGTSIVGRRGLTCLTNPGGDLVGRRGLTWGSLRGEDLNSRKRHLPAPMSSLEGAEIGQIGKRRLSSCRHSHHRRSSQCLQRRHRRSHDHLSHRWRSWRRP